MEAVGNILMLCAGVFSWAISLSWCGRVLFRSTGIQSCALFVAGFMINVILIIVIDLPFHRMLYSETDWRNEWLLTFLIFLPLGVGGFVIAYTWVRNRILVESDESSGDSCEVVDTDIQEQQTTPRNPHER